MRSSTNSPQPLQPDDDPPATDDEVDYGSPFDAAYGVPEEQRPYIPAPVATTSGPPAPPRTRPAWFRITLAIALTIAIASVLALLLARGT